MRVLIGSESSRAIITINIGDTELGNLLEQNSLFGHQLRLIIALLIFAVVG